MTPDHTELVDAIYEAAFAPEMWSGVLQETAAAIDAEGALLFTSRGTLSRSIVSPGIRETVRAFNEAGWGARNTRAARLLADMRDGFVTDFDLFSEEELRREPMYSEFLVPNGYGWGAATSIQLSSGDIFIISYEKKYAAGPVDRNGVRYLDALRPHFARSAFLSARLEFERITGAMAALELTGLPSAVLSASGKVIAANRLFEAGQAAFTIGSRARLRTSHPSTDQVVRLAMDKLEIGEYPPVQSIPLFAPDRKLPGGIMHFLPLRGIARDFFSGAAGFVIVTPVAADHGPAEHIVQALFDLSPAEARVARALLKGKNIRQIAADHDVSVHTVRTHVKRILEKSGMSRQAEFVAALSRIGSLPVGSGASVAG